MKPQEKKQMGGSDKGPKNKQQSPRDSDKKKPFLPDVEMEDEDMNEDRERRSNEFDREDEDDSIVENEDEFRDEDPIEK